MLNQHQRSRHAVISSVDLHTAGRNKETMERSSLSFYQCFLGTAVSVQSCSLYASCLLTSSLIGPDCKHCSKCLSCDASAIQHLSRHMGWLDVGTSADMYRTVFELLVSVKLFLGRFDMRTMQVSNCCLRIYMLQVAYPST